MHLTYERSLTKEIQSINDILCNPNNPYLCTKVRKLPRSRSRTRRLHIILIRNLCANFWAPRRCRPVVASVEG